MILRCSDTVWVPAHNFWGSSKHGPLHMLVAFKEKSKHKQPHEALQTSIPFLQSSQWFPLLTEWPRRLCVWLGSCLPFLPHLEALSYYRAWCIPLAFILLPHPGDFHHKPDFCASVSLGLNIPGYTSRSRCPPSHSIASSCFLVIAFSTIWNYLVFYLYKFTYCPSYTPSTATPTPPTHTRPVK